MNATFNLKRFLLLEQYNLQETCKHLLWSACIVFSICLLCILFDLNHGAVYVSSQSSATSFVKYTIGFLLIAPCLLETNLTKRNSTLYILLPASVFEKFLHIWIKYLLLLPVFCALLILCLKGLFSLTDITYLNIFSRDIASYIISKDYIITFSILQATFFIGYFGFKRQLLLKSLAISVAIFSICMGIILLIITLMPEKAPECYWVDNLGTWPRTNYPLSATTLAIVNFCNYAVPICFVLGSWISSYFLLKEKQL